jgi:Ca2+-binding RTX toxin-like protein
LSINLITDAILPSLNAGAVNGEKISSQVRNERRRGTDDSEIFFGFGGNDAISAGGGNDHAFGGRGDDLIFGG